MENIYILRYRWEIIGIFPSAETAETCADEICRLNYELVESDKRWRAVARIDFVIKEQKIGLFYPINQMAKTNGAFWVQ